MKAPTPEPQVKYRLDDDGCFVIENYNHSKTFSNFFPGVAGVWGIPMWVFYVNRGQCISSFGIESKDKAILEFQPANKAYRLTSLQGFRTFIKVADKKSLQYWEPFQDGLTAAAYRVRQKMSITAHDLTLEEVNETLGLTVTVNYFTLPQEDFPALVRTVTITNTSRKEYSLEVVDGLPMIMPYGMSDWIIKNMSRTVEAWVKVKNVKNRAPYYHLNVEVSDTPDVRHITEGNFYFAFDPDRDKSVLCEPIVNAGLVFGQNIDFSFPAGFAGAETFSVPDKQQTSNRTPSAMHFRCLSLNPGKHKTTCSLIGQARKDNHLKTIVNKVTKKGFVARKAQENRDLIGGIMSRAHTNSSSQIFDLYAGQTFLDNVLRGGLPVSLKTGEGHVAVNVFSRKHGDPERDYNYFLLSPTHFSQGNGNYRDVNQNRRNDVWFNRDVRDNSLVNFLSLSQADGYNPLVVKGLSFSAPDSKKMGKVLSACVKSDPQPLRERLQKEFQPGELLDFIVRRGVKLKVSQQDFLSQVLGVCRKHEVADFVEGYWSDHWTYNLDLVESYLALYPDDLEQLLLHKRSFCFYHSSHYVLPRDQRYILTEKGVRQYHNVKDGVKHIPAAENGFKLRTRNGKGEIYYTNLLVKLLCLVVNKAATFDPSGIGIEMEGGRPNWYDALNGLPGLLGSSINETLELKRLALFLKESLAALSLSDKESFLVFLELADFLHVLKAVFEAEKDPALLWHQANDIKEKYRARVKNGIDGDEITMTVGEIRDFLSLVIARADKAQAQALNSKGQLATYFSHEVVDHAVLDRQENGLSYVLPVKFRKHALPLFLEGFVHALRVERDPQKAREIYLSVKNSPIYDKKLKMYRNNADLSRESEEIGRTRIFPSGWLENGSVWLHMEYKFLLELLRCGLNKEFYDNLHNVLVPFLKPEQYGRSTLENSSFLVSSAHEDASLHGRGFVARLSGSTAEFVHIWLVMNVGFHPFVLDKNGKLGLRFQPVLDARLFTGQETTTEFFAGQSRRSVTLPPDTYAFQFLGTTLVVYHNPRRKDTFGAKAAVIEKYALTYPGRKIPVTADGDTLAADQAEDVRSGKVSRMDVFLA